MAVHEETATNTSKINEGRIRHLTLLKNREGVSAELIKLLYSHFIPEGTNKNGRSCLLCRR
jgi:hypothetical protein